MFAMASSYYGQQEFNFTSLWVIILTVVANKHFWDILYPKYFLCDKKLELIKK